MIAPGAQQSRLTLHLSGYVRPRENQNADSADLASLGEGLLSDIRKLQRADPTFGGRKATHIAESSLLGDGSNDGSWDDTGAFVVQPIRLVIFWTDPDWIDIAIKAVEKACKGIRLASGYRNTVKYVSRRMTDPDDLASKDIPAIWVVRPLGGSEELTYIDQ